MEKSGESRPFCFIVFQKSLLSQFPSHGPPTRHLAMALPARKAVVRAFGDRGLRLEARALAMLTSHVEQAAEKASTGLLKATASTATTPLPLLLRPPPRPPTPPWPSSWTRMSLVRPASRVMKEDRSELASGAFLVFLLHQSLIFLFSLDLDKQTKKNTQKQKATPPASPPRRPRASSPRPRARTRRR